MFDLPGLYAYVHKITGKVYVGSSARIFSRLGWHMSAFKTSRGHRNSGMQYDVSLYGAYFYVFLLDTRSYLNVADFRLTQEHVWIYKLGEQCYNKFYMKYIDAFLRPAVYVHGVYYESAYLGIWL